MPSHQDPVLGYRVCAPYASRVYHAAPAPKGLAARSFIERLWPLVYFSAEQTLVTALLYESPKDSLGKCFVLLSIGTHLRKL